MKTISLVIAILLVAVSAHAADWRLNTKTAKTPLVDADILLIEDSAASWAVKKITGTTLKSYTWSSAYIASLNPTFGNVTAGGGTLSAGVASTTQGALVLYSNTGVLTAGWLPAASPTGSVTLRFPPAAAGGNNYLLNFDTDGTGGFTDPATFTDDQTAAEVLFTPEGSIAATTVQAAIQEVRDEAGGGSMTWPSTAGIPYWTSGTAWGGAYNATTKIPADYVSTLNQNTTGTAAGLSGTPNITVGTISAGAAGFMVDADGDMSVKSISTTAADGSRRSIIPNNTSIAPLGDGSEEIYNEGGALKAVENDTEYDIILSRDIGGAVQAYDADLDDLADGTLSESKIDATVARDTEVRAKYISGTEADFYGTLLAPQEIYAVDGTNHAVTLINDVPAAFTITEISVSCDADPTTETTFTFQHKAAGVGYGSPTTIEAVLTVNGAATITSGIDDATIPAGTKVFMTLSDPDDALNECSWQIEGDWD